MDRFLKVTAWMSSPIAGDLPFLDAILEGEMAYHSGAAYHLRRDKPCPKAGSIHIPMLRKTIGGLSVACCSSPIVSSQHTSVERFAKRLSVENAELLTPKKRLVVIP